MKTSSTWNLRSIVGKIMTGLFLASMIGSIDIVPAFGDDRHERMEQHDRGRYERHRGREYRPYYGYRERYVPPRVIYVPPRPPGIGIFFPPVFPY